MINRFILFLVLAWLALLDVRTIPFGRSSSDVVVFSGKETSGRGSLY